MDAQNAAQSDQTRPAAASPQLPGPQPETTSSPAPTPTSAPEPEPKSESKPESTTAATPTIAPVSPRAAEPGTKESKDGKESKESKGTKDVTKSPMSPKDPKDCKDSKPSKEPRPVVNPPPASDQDLADERDSDAETIVLPGKDGHSPSKVRKVRQEDRSDGDGDAAKSSIKAASTSHDADKPVVVSCLADRVAAAKKKRLAGHMDREKQPRTKDVSSGLSSAPTSPPRRRRRSDGPRSSSDSEPSHPRPSKTMLRDKLKSGERLLPHKRKGPTKADSDDEAEGRKVRRQRTTSIGTEPGRLHKEHKTSSKARYEARNRSISPQARSHRRSASLQQPSHSSSNGLMQKKKRVPPALQTTEYHSDDSSASGSPHPRNFKHRALPHPSSADHQVSPAKMGPHKKHLDAHGQTLLARACARGEYDGAKLRLGERPEDLNVADYAGNTPLQIAAINGCEDIVKLLIDAGCNLDCVNYDKDTPLLDAVDNGHLGVVKLLLAAGVNPRKANVNGEEPIDRVSDETENADEIRAALLDAKKRQGGRRRTSEDRHSHPENDTCDSHALESPRQSPAALLSGSAGRRGGTVRATKTRNDLLYMPLDEKTLRQAAGRGDEETVARILQVKEGFDDPESMVAAARGGHDLVIQLLLGLGGANPDPAPILGAQSEFGTPILAAIGQENIKVVELLLEQQGFDPTRRFKGETYYEIARRRQGTNWKEEEQMLKNHYDEYKRSHKDSGKNKSPNRRDRGGEREEREPKRVKRSEAKEETRLQRRNLPSPSREFEPKKKMATKLSSPKEKRRSESFHNHGDDQPKRGPGRPKKDDKLPSINVSDREVSPSLSHKQLKTKRSESDPAATGISSEGESVKPRRKLISKAELKGRGEREKQRRASMVSNASSLKDHPSSPHDSRNDEPSDKHRVEKLSEKYHDRTKALKRDDSRDRLSVSGDGSSKRHRASTTPDRPSNGDKEDSEVPTKRRRLDSDTKEKRSKVLSADERPRKSKSAHDAVGKASVKVSAKPRHKSREEERRERRSNSRRRDSGRSSSAERMIHVKSEEVDIDMKDAEPIKPTIDTDTQAVRDKQAEREKQRLAEQAEAKKRKEKEKEEKEAEQRKQAEAEAKLKREKEEARLKEEEEERKRKEEEEKKRKEEEEREAEKKRKEEEERKRREEEEKLRREAEEKARREEEERKRLEEEKRKKEEEERKQREEEERLHQEQLEREAAEEARRQREEEERKERERRERAHREEMERKRAAREAEQKRLREEQERIRLDKLPPLLRWLDMCPNPRQSTVAQRFKRIQGVRYDTIRPEANQTAEGRELWVLNTHVALLLGEKDLHLSRYTAWEKVPVSPLAKRCLWRVEWKLYSLLDEKLWDFGQQLPNYYGDDEPCALPYLTKERLKMEAWERFRNTDMFFVKVSDLMYTIPNIPHLRNAQLGVEYRELLESEDQEHGWRAPQKWKQDPDASRFYGFAPRHRYYINGAMVSEEKPSSHQTSNTPFPEKRVPRRGLYQVYPDDPEYARICMEQGLMHLLNGQSSPAVNGLHSSPISQRSATPARSVTNGAAKALAVAMEGVEGPHAANGGLTNGVKAPST